MFAYGELFMLVMKEYIFMFKNCEKMQNSGLEIVAGLTRSVIWLLQARWAKSARLSYSASLIIVKMQL